MSSADSKPLARFEVWFVTGSQHLYGAEALEQVAEHAASRRRRSTVGAEIPVRVVFKPVVTTPEASAGRPARPTRPRTASA